MSKSLVLPLFCLLVGGAASYFACNRHFKAELAALTPKVDTLVISQVRVVEKPVYIEKRICDTMRIAISDTCLVVRHDTTYISLPREQKVYADTSYRAVVSGIEPRLDSLSFAERTKYVYITPQKSHWSFGISAGLSTIYSFESRKPDVGAGITLGVQYKF